MKAAKWLILIFILGCDPTPTPFAPDSRSRDVVPRQLLVKKAKILSIKKKTNKFEKGKGTHVMLLSIDTNHGPEIVKAVAYTKNPPYSLWSNIGLFQIGRYVRIDYMNVRFNVHGEPNRGNFCLLVRDIWRKEYESL